MQSKKTWKQIHDREQSDVHTRVGYRHTQRERLKRERERTGFSLQDEKDVEV
jgi:hypothetical protein